MKVKDPNTLFYKPFDCQTHSDNFFYYCEVVIYPDGLIEYAVPSHERKLIAVFAKQKGMSLEEAIEFCRNFGIDYFEYLMHETGICFVWYDHLYNGTNLTKEQNKAISKLLLYKCISDECLTNIQNYEPFYSKYELINDARNNANISYK